MVNPYETAHAMSVITILTALPICAAIAYTLVLLNVWQRASPPAGAEAEAAQQLARRNAWIDDFSILLCIGGLALPLVLFKQHLDQAGWPAVGLALGSAVALPVVWVCIVTLPRGSARLGEFWTYFSRRYLVSPMLMLGFCAVFALAGAASVIALVMTGAG